MNAASNLSDELSELDFSSENFIGGNHEAAAMTRSCINVDLNNLAYGPVNLSRKSVSTPFQQLCRSRLVQPAPMGLEMQARLEQLIDKQQCLIDWFKRQNKQLHLIVQATQKDYNSSKQQLSEFVTSIMKALGMQQLPGDLDKTAQKIQQSIEEIKNEQTLAKSKSQTVIVDDGKYKPRKGTHNRVATGLYRQREEDRPTVDNRYRNVNQTVRYKEKEKQKEKEDISALLKELDELKQENRKLKQSSKTQIPVFVTSPKDRRVEIVVERIVEKEKIVEREKIVEKPVYINRDRPVFIEKIVEKKVPVVVEKIKQVPVEVIVEKVVYRDREVPVEKIVSVEKIVEKVVFVDRPKRRQFIQLDRPKTVVEPIYIDRQIEVEKIVYLQASNGLRLFSTSTQTIQQ